MGQEQSTHRHLNPDHVGEPGNNPIVRTAVSNDGEHDEGVIQVVSDVQDDGQDDEILRIKKVKQFVPFVRDNERGFGIDGLLSLTVTNKAPAALREQSDPVEVDPEPLADALFRVHQHIEFYKGGMRERQRALHEQLQYVERLSQHTTKTLLLAMNQAKNANERIPEIRALATHAEKTKRLTDDIFGILSGINSRLDSDDRMDEEAVKTRWPALSQLFNAAPSSTGRHADTVTSYTADDASLDRVRAAADASDDK